VVLKLRTIDTDWNAFLDANSSSPWHTLIRKHHQLLLDAQTQPRACREIIRNAVEQSRVWFTRYRLLVRSRGGAVSAVHGCQGSDMDGLDGLDGLDMRDVVVSFPTSFPCSATRFGGWEEGM
jgi:hypothetical protein